MHIIPWWRRFDPLLVVTPLLLVIYGMALIHSATCQPDCQQWFPPSSWAVRHGIFAVIGFLAMGLVSCLDYRLSRTLAYYGYFAALGLLVVVLFVGHEGGDQDYGARRWIALGVFDLQASEVAKIGLILALARW